MASYSRFRAVKIVAPALLLFGSAAQAQSVAQCLQVPCDDVHTVASATTGVPVEHDFDATAGTTYYVTLTDFGAQFPTTPDPLSTLKLAITFDDALVSLTPAPNSGSASAMTQLVVDGPNAVSINGTATVSFTANGTGAYRIHVVGAPVSGNAPGPIGIQVSATQGGTALESWSDAIGLPVPPPAAAEGVLEKTFVVTTGGQFQISINDLSLPQPLQAAPVLIVLNGGPSPVALLPDPSHNMALQETVTLAAGTYQIFAAGLAGTNAPGGLFSASVIPVAGGSGAPSFAWTTPVGRTIQVGASAVQLTSGASYALKLSDLAFPTALSQVSAVAVDVSEGTAAARLAAAGTQNFTAAGGTPGDTYAIYAVAQAAAPIGAGSYAAQIVSQSGATVVGGTEPVTMAGSSLSAYSFTTSVNVTSSSSQPYSATLTDFTIPSALGVADFALVDGSTSLGTSVTGPGSLNANLSVGAHTLTLLAFVTPSAAGGSLFDLNIADGAANLVFDQPQAAGIAFEPTQISITTKGTYQFTLADLAWPAGFSQSGGQLAGVLTQGGKLIGEIFGGGALNSVSVTTPGNYYLNIIVTPSGPDQAGTYALNVGTAPAAPTVNLTSDASSVTSGGTVHLIWTTTGATSCTASGGGWSGTFTGSQATGDTGTSPAITANTTFTLTCSGAGGQTAGTVNVTVATSSSTGSSGGGGELGSALLLVMGACAAARLVRRCADPQN